MSRVLAYTGPSEGHLYPLVPTLIELDERGHEVAVRTMAKEVSRLRDMGFEASPVADGIAEREADDGRPRRAPRWRASCSRRQACCPAAA